MSIFASVVWASCVWMDTPLAHHTTAILAGLSILGAAFLLSWIVDAAELDMPPALAVSLLALIAVLPEYAVDATFAWKAATDPKQAAYAIANMTGGNRLLLGIGWSSLILVAWVRHRATRITLTEGGRVDLAILIVASAYALVPVFRGELTLLDTCVFVTMYLLYIVATIRQTDEDEEEELVGPAALLNAYGTLARRISILLLFIWAAWMIFIAAEPFAEALVHTGIEHGIDEFLLVQWVAPLASESPEFAVAWLLIMRKRMTKGLMLLVSAKVNQWTLLVGTLPVVTSISGGTAMALPLDPRQQGEVVLTAMQSVFGVAVLANLALNRWQAFLLAVLFMGQLLAPETRNAFAVVYAVGAIGTLLVSRSHGRGILDAFKATFHILRGR